MPKFLQLWKRKKKKKCSTTFTCKRKGAGEKEGRAEGWFWHIFSAVIMDPSYGMICSYTWLTELSSVNKHSTHIYMRSYTHSEFPLFPQTSLCLPRWPISLSLSLSLCLSLSYCFLSLKWKKSREKKESVRFPLVVHQRHLQSDI